MTTVQLTLNLPERLAREAQAAGLLTSEALAQLLRDAMRRRAGLALLAGASAGHGIGQQADLDEGNSGGG